MRDFYAVLDQVLALLRQRGRVSYRALKRQFDLDDAYLDDLKVELIKGQHQARDEDGEVLVWTGAAPSSAAPAPTPPPAATPPPLAYTPPYLAEKILTTRRAMEGERKQVTVLRAGAQTPVGGEPAGIAHDRALSSMPCPHSEHDKIALDFFCVCGKIALGFL